MSVLARSRAPQQKESQAEQERMQETFRTLNSVREIGRIAVGRPRAPSTPAFIELELDRVGDFFEKSLSNSDEHIVSTAKAALVSIGLPVAEMLIEEALNPTIGTRRIRFIPPGRSTNQSALVEILTEMGEGVVPLITQRLHDVKGYPASGVQNLVTVLKEIAKELDGQDQVRLNILSGESKAVIAAGPQAVPVIVEFMCGRNPLGIIIEAYSALGAIGGPQAARCFMDAVITVQIS